MKKHISIWITAAALSLTMLSAHGMGGGWGDNESLHDGGDSHDEEGGPVVSVPEPGTLGLLALGIAGIAATRRKKK